MIDDYDLVATANSNPLAPLLELLPQARDLGLHLVVARRSGGAARAMFEPLLAGLARCRLHGVADERKPGRGPDDWVCPPVAHAARPRHADHSPGQPAAGAGCLESAAMSTHVVEVGPNTIRQLCCGGEVVDDDEMVRAAFDSIDDPVTLIDLRPVTVDSLWRTVLGSHACGSSDRVIVVHPSWWAPTRIDLVSAAARSSPARLCCDPGRGC